MSEEVKNKNQTAEKKEKGANKPLSKAVKVALRREKISELMLAGVDDGGVRRIAEYLSKIGFECSKSTVANDIKFILKESEKNTTENLELKRAYNNLRLEQLIQAHWIPAQTKIASGKFVRSLIDDQNELYGLKAAKKLEVTGEDGGPINVRRSIDLSGLTTEELLLMEALVAKTANQDENAA